VRLELSEAAVFIKLVGKHLHEQQYLTLSNAFFTSFWLETALSQYIVEFSLLCK
jgi:hypothetical protein